MTIRKVIAGTILGTVLPLIVGETIDPFCDNGPAHKWLVGAMAIGVTYSVKWSAEQFQ